VVPSKSHIAEIEKDYGRMQNMLFGDTPSFPEILTNLQRFEEELNASH